MTKSHPIVADKNINDLLQEARQLFNTAATLTGAQAEKVRNEATQLLDTALSTVQKTSKEAVTSADHYVKENPWKMVAVVAGIGLLAGILLGRK